MKKIALFLLTSLFFAGCAEDDFVSNSQGDSRYISFVTDVTEMEDLDATRGGGHHNTAHHHDMAGAKTPMFARFTQTNNIDKYLKTRKQGAIEDVETRGRRIDNVSDFYDSFGLIYFMYDPVLYTWAANGNSFTPFIHNEQVRRINGWRTQEYWPGTGRDLMFFAYAPYNAKGVTLSSATDTGTPWLHHEVPLNAVDESDLLISAEEHEVGNYNAIRHIDFKHICAGVRFGIGNQMAPGTIKRIQLQDVYGEGWYHFGATAWDSVKTEKTFTLEQNFTIAPGESNRLLTTGDNVFMMVPQEVPTNGKIVVTINDGEDHELTAYVAHDHWDIGTTTTYWLSTLVTEGDTVLYVATTYDTDSVPYSGGTANYEVSSYYTTAYGTRSPIPWTASYQIDDAATIYTTVGPTVTSMTFSGGSTVASTMVSASIAGQTGVEVGDFGSWGADKASVFDLSTHDLDENPIAQTTANTYVVNSRGTYTLPLVYGNARKNGMDNAAAYGYGGTTSQTFVDHNNILIDNPYIYQSNGGVNAPDGATIVWQTEQNLISSVSLVNSNHDLQFSIGNLKEGNAIVAATKNGTIVWSWQIWVTKRKGQLSTTIAVDDYDDSSKKYNFMPVPLGVTGYTIGGTTEYAERKVKITVTQSGSGQTGTFVVTQTSASVPVAGDIGTAPYYEWGRKDPQPPHSGSLYNSSNGSYSYGSVSFSNMGAVHQSPGQFGSATYYYHQNTSNPGAKQNRDYWNVGYDLTTVNSNVVVKSVYDPCPQGFCVPAPAAFRVFTANGSNGGTKNILKAWDSSMGGYYFYTVKASSVVVGTTPTIFIPAYGERNNGNGTLNSVGSEGQYWTSGHYNNSGDGRLLVHNSSSVNPTDYRYIDHASSVMAVRE